MQVTGIKNYTFTNSTKTTFNGWERNVFPTMTYAGIKVPTSHIPLYRNNTWIFRDNKVIPEIMGGVVSLNKDVPHVNTLIYGCSNGAGTLSMYMFLAAKYGKEVLSKFIPFIAMDIDEYAISVAKSGELPVDYDEFLKIQIYTRNKFNEFFDGKKFGVPDGCINPFEHNKELKKIFKREEHIVGGGIETGRRFMVNKKHLKHIKYQVGDIVEDCENIEPARTFVNAQNIFPYLRDSDILKTIKTFGKRLPKNSSIALDSYDLVPIIDRSYSFDMETLLADNGFVNKGTGSEFLFKKL